MTDTTTTPAETPPEPGPLTAEELGRRILKESGLTVAELLSLPHEDKYDVAGNAWEHGHHPPGNDKLIIVAIFVGDQHETQNDHVAGDVRAYTMPVDARNDDSPDKHHYRRYTLNRSSPTLRSTRMSLATFIDEISAEWYDLAVLRGVVEEDEDEEEPEE